jgi:hypothetical protein
LIHGETQYDKTSILQIQNYCLQEGAYQKINSHLINLKKLQKRQTAQIIFDN